MHSLNREAVFLALVTLVAAQSYGGGYGGGYSGNPYSSDGTGNSGQFGSSSLATILNSKRSIVIAHAVMAAAAFVFFFPVGAIIIRLGSFRGLWLVHALFQIFAWLLYIAAFGIGVYMARNLRVIGTVHPIIGIVVFVLLLFQPILGLMHHVMFKKHSRRVVWSYGHIWLGRIVITLGIINGGLGLRLSRQLNFFSPSNGAIIAYGVVAAILWLIYVAAAVFGELKRSRAQRNALPVKPDPATQPGAPNGTAEYYKNQSEGQRYA